MEGGASRDTSGIPTDEERHQKMSNDELRAKNPSWVAYYLVAEARRGDPLVPVDRWGAAKERLGEIFPNLTKEQVDELMLAAGTKYNRFEQDEYVSPEEDK